MKFRLLIVCFLSISSIIAHEPVVTIYYYERMPFFGQLATENEGFLLKIMREIFESADISYSFNKAPVSRIFEILKNDTGNSCFPGVFRTLDREKLYIYSEFPIYQDSSPHFIIRKNDELFYRNIFTIDTLLNSNKMIGLVEKYSYGIWVDDNIRKYQPPSVVINIGDNQKNFYKMLLANRFDYFFSSIEEASYLINSNQDFADRLLLKELIDAPSGNIRWIIFNPGFNKELLSRINNAIPIVKRSSRYKEITAITIK
jgi:polar amino acid transport system substrate-binding protein